MRFFRRFSRLISGLIALAIIGSLAVFPTAAQTPTMTLDRTEFVQGDDISVHYTGSSGKDWIAIYKKGQQPGAGGPQATVYEYTSKTGQPDGIMDFKDTDRGDVKELSLGEYDIYLLEDDGYNILAQSSFVIKDGSEGDKDSYSISADKKDYGPGERPVFSYTGSTHNDAWIGIYSADGDHTPRDGNPSLVWSYTRNYGQPDGSTDLQDQSAEGTMAMEKLPLGEYYAYLFADGGYTIVAECTFTLSPRDPALCPAPRRLKYDRTAKYQGYADGTVTITPSANAEGLTGYQLYWGDANGPLADYTGIPVTAAAEGDTVRELNASTQIPYGATRLYAFAVYDGNAESPDGVFVELDSGAAAKEEQPFYSFQVLSDTHITTDPGHIHNQHLRMALEDIKKTDPDSIGIFHVGDVTDNGEVAQYVQYNTIVNSFDDIPYIYCVPGNHDLRNQTYDMAVDRFLENTNAPSGYYSKEVGDATFIFLVSQDLDNWDLDRSAAHLRDDQLAFLKAELEKAADGMKPIFVFLHQPLYNTVSGSLPGQNWHGVDKDAELREILRQYPQVVFFTGHTHWELDSKSVMYAGNGEDATMFNDAAVGYLWTDDDTEKKGSQGFYVEVYADKLLVRGRDFVSEKWISGAQFIVDLSQNIKGLTNQVSENEDMLISQKTQIEALLADIRSLPADRVSEYKEQDLKLTGFLNKIKALELKADIDVLPDAADIDIEYKAAVNMAWQIFSGFTDDQKEILGTAAAEKLTALKAAIDKLAPDITKGDVDSNGTVNVSDMLTLKNLIMSGSWTSEQLAAGDMNEDNNLTVGDILAIKNIIMGK